MIKRCDICKKLIKKGQEYSKWERYNKWGERVIKEFRHTDCSLPSYDKLANSKIGKAFLKELEKLKNERSKSLSK